MARGRSILWLVLRGAEEKECIEEEFETGSIFYHRTLTLVEKE
jgi:hypothetical protein